MPRGRRRSRRAVEAGFRGFYVRYEWTGFRDGGTPANLNTSVLFELVPPDGASAVVNLLPKIRRVVGNIGFTSQSTVTSASTVGAMLFMANVGADQTIDADVPPLTTDPDDFNNKGIMWWQTWQAVLSEGPAADWDEHAHTVPIDIKVNRQMRARDTLVLRLDAGTTARTRATVNLRVLISMAGG